MEHTVLNNDLPETFNGSDVQCLEESGIEATTRKQCCLMKPKYSTVAKAMI